jgi:hypothetical protein
LYDTQLRDDDIYKALTAFKPGVRILMLSDSCHSESVNRDMAMARESKRAADSSEGGKRAPLDVTVQEFEDHENQYLKRKGARPSDVTADVILISGCQDDQESRDGLTNGAFTRAFLDVWANGAFAGSHLALHDQVRARVQELGFAQVPGWNPLGGVDGSLDRFIQQQPLVV